MNLIMILLVDEVLVACFGFYVVGVGHEIPNTECGVLVVKLWVRVSMRSRIRL